MSSNPNSTVSSIYEPQAATILSGQTESSSVDLYGTTAAGLIVPALIGDSITYLVSADTINFFPLTDDETGTPVTSLLNGTNSQAVSFVPPKFFPWRALKIVVGSPVDGDKIFSFVPKGI